MKHESMNIRRVIRANRLLAEQGHKGDTLAALSEMEALRKDAERYRWLREHGDNHCTEKDGYGGQTLKMGECLDDAVDAAMAAQRADDAA